MTTCVSVPLVRPDIELPPRTRAGDALVDRRASPAKGSVPDVACDPGWPERSPALPFIVDRLLWAPGPFGLEVEIKSDDRVVGTWSLEINPRSASESFVSQAKASLHVCGSARRDPRATGAFLVVTHWWVQVADSQRLEQLYAALSIATIERLDSLLGASAEGEVGDDRSCVLYLIDGRRRDRQLFSPDRLQIRILEDLERDHAIPGLDLRVAHHLGAGTQPHVGFASTRPDSTMLGSDRFSADEGAGRPAQPWRRVDNVFVRETLSPANMRWNRRATDRQRAE